MNVNNLFFYYTSCSEYSAVTNSKFRNTCTEKKANFVHKAPYETSTDW